METQHENAIIELLKKREGKLVPSFKPEVCDGYYAAFKRSLVKDLYAMMETGKLVRDFIHWTPKKHSDPDVDGKIRFKMNGHEVTRILRRDGSVGEAIFYVPELVPEWINRKNAQRIAAKEVKAEILGNTEELLADGKIPMGEEDKAL